MSAAVVVATVFVVVLVLVSAVVVVDTPKSPISCINRPSLLRAAARDEIGSLLVLDIVVAAVGTIVAW